MGRLITRRKPGDLPLSNINSLSGKKVVVIMFRKLYLFIVVVFCGVAVAQQDSVIVLKQLDLVDFQLNNFSTAQKVTSLSDSLISKNQPSLTDLLRNNSTIYFKENGKGMVSSSSFRGTTAQQTAVVWNGININSQFNGQTDFNTVNTREFNSIAIRAGGGSVLYGSGAIGGSIHLNNDIKFEKGFSNQIQLNYGSFETIGAHYDVLVSDEKKVFKASVTHNASKNEYPYIGYNKKNQNGDYFNTSFATQVGIQLYKNTFLKYFTHIYDGSRNFSGTIASPSKSKYINYDVRNLVELSNYQRKLTSKLKVAYLTESYKYFENKNTSNFSFANGKTVIAKYDGLYSFTPKAQLNAIIDFTRNSGLGSDISQNNREITSFSLLFKQQLFQYLTYEASLRKESTSNYESPLLYSFGMQLKPMRWYSVLISGSKNYRIPTFNDLYWQESGNLLLKPESSQQFEVTNELKVAKSIVFTTTFYQTKLQDMLRWLPNSNGTWQPINTDKVSIFGFETQMTFKKKIQQSVFEVKAMYSYTNSKDEKTQKQLIYVPFHLFNGTVSYQYKSFGAFYQSTFNGLVYTSSDNESSLKEYLVFNAGIDYNFKKINTLVGLQINNLENKPYQNVLSRPLPGRHIMMNMNFKF